MPTLTRLRRAVAVLAVGVIGVPLGAQSTPSLPERLTDREFRQMIGDLSEPGGYFRSDNFLSNETGFQWVIPRLAAGGRTGGVYLGVGPEQNFTYLAALRPRIAFIFDIRRQNVIEHLLYKALFELSADRADFLSALFARPRPAGLDTASTAEALFGAYAAAAPDSALYLRTTRAVAARLEARGIALDSADQRALAYVEEAFFAAGPALDYSFAPGRSQRYGFYRRGMPSYAELMTQMDSSGIARSYLATEANYRTVRDLQARNVVVPLVGDFAGPRAIRAVGQYLRDHGATVSAFYTSNVEQYLFRQGDDWRRFLDNVATLPVDSSSVFIRAVFNGFRVRPQPAPSRPWMRSSTLLCSIPGLLAAYEAGKVVTYEDVIAMSR